MAKLLGISAFYHDSAAALIDSGRILAAAQEERFTRKKHDPGFPSQAIQYCLKEAGLSLKDLDGVVFYEKPFLKFERLIETYLSFSPRGYKSFRLAIPLWLREKLFQKDYLLKEIEKLTGQRLDPSRLFFSEHHFSHAASAFFPSPFEEAIVLTMDGVGEWATTSVAVGRGNHLSIEKEIHFPHSLGLLYSAFTYYLGFKVNSGEYKVMGLAPYGKPRFKGLIFKHLIDLKADGSFRLNMNYFAYASELKMINRKFIELFGEKEREAEKDPITQFHMDVAASIQAVCEEVVLRMAGSLAQEYKIPNLCLAGGVALNCVANGKILKEKIFENIWIQPAAGDAGGALGAALGFYFQEMKMPREGQRGDQMSGAYLGPSFDQTQIESELAECGARFETRAMDEILEVTSHALANGKAVGWFQGRMEFGPRALGNRSILADARDEHMQKNLNLKIKYRESFRPFAPSVLREDLSKWFTMDCDTPYMLLVADARDKNIPAVTHVDSSARIQSVHNETNPIFHSLISRFKELTGCSVLINTSFNVRGEPIVCTPTDAFRCFMGTELDLLVCGNSILKKEDQNQNLREDYKSKYTLD